MENETKRCFKCKETVLKGAQKCKHCGADLRNWFNKHKILSGILGLIIFIAAINSLKKPESTTKSQADSTDANEAVSAEQKVENAEKPTTTPRPTFGKGDDVQVGDIRWKLVDAQDWGNKLSGSKSKYPAFTKTKTSATGKYIYVVVEVENMSKDMKSASNLKLVDNQGREFIHSTDTSEWVPEGKEMFLLSNLNPNVPQQFADIYEIPVDARGLKLVVGDLSLFGSKSERIELGF